MMTPGWLLLLELTVLGGLFLLGGALCAMHRATNTNAADVKGLLADVGNLKESRPSREELERMHEENRKDHQDMFESLNKLHQRLAKINGEVA